MKTYEFKLALKSEEELATTEAANVPGPTETLPNGESKVKTLYAITETEEEALEKVDAYVAKTQYRDIPDQLIVP